MKSLYVTNPQQKQTSSALILLARCQQTCYLNTELYYIGRDQPRGLVVRVSDY